MAMARRPRRLLPLVGGLLGHGLAGGDGLLAGRSACSKRSRAMASMPKVAEQLAEDVVGRHVAVLELLPAGRHLVLMNWRTASRTICCSSDHWYTGTPHLLPAGRPRLDWSVKVAAPPRLVRSASVP